MGLYKNMLEEPVSRLALREALTVAPNTSIREAVLLMREKRLGCVIAIDADRKPLGIFTEAMLRHLLAENPSGVDEPVESHMAQQFAWVTDQDPVVTVLEAMQAKNYRFVCVCSEAGQVIGLTGQKGLMEYIAEHFPQQVMTQNLGSRTPGETREGA